ncbi:hypothetical protein AB6O49_26890 [Streptomyces sp. SBR177]
MTGRVRGFLADLFGPRRPAWPGDYYAVRTWDRADGRDCLQLSLQSDTAGADEARDRVRDAAGAHGLRPEVAELPFEEIPSPLWNSGIGGEGVDAVAKRLYRAVSPLLVTTVSALGDDPADKTRAYVPALDLMVANAAATVAESEQRRLSSRGFGELLALRMLSYRSHYEGAKHALAKDPEAFERRCAAFYERLGPRVRELIRACADAPDATPGGEPAAPGRGSYGSISEPYGKNVAPGASRIPGAPSTTSTRTPTTICRPAPSTRRSCPRRCRNSCTAARISWRTGCTPACSTAVSTPWDSVWPNGSCSATSSPAPTRRSRE